MMKSRVIMDILERIEDNQISMEEGEGLLNCLDKSIYYKVRWDMEDLVDEIEETDDIVFIFPDEEDYLDMSEYLDSGKCICVVNDNSFQVCNKNLYKMDFTHEEQYALLFKEWKNNNSPLKRIVFFTKKAGKPGSKDVRENMDYGIISVFLFTKKLVTYMPEVKTSFSVIIQDMSPLNTAIIGFAKTVNQEQHLINMRCVGFSQEYLRTIDPESFIKVIYKEACNESNNQEIIYIGNERRISTVEEIEYHEDETYFMECLNNKVFVIVGYSVLGRMLAYQYAMNNKCKVIMVGRKQLQGEVKEFIDQMQKNNLVIKYYQADILDEERMQEVASQIEMEYGGIDYLIHTAGIISDNFLKNKTKEEFIKVIEPKVIGTLNLISAFRGKKVKRVVLFSSFASLGGNVGQSDYAYGNMFLNKIAESGKEYTDFEHITSICWPYWKNGGMQIEEEILERMKYNLGIEPMETEVGLIAMELFLREKYDVCGVLQGDYNKIKNLINSGSKMLKENSLHNDSEAAENDLIECYDETKELLKNIFAQAIKIPIERVSTSITFDEYGVDSIIVNAVNDELIPIFGDVDGTLLFQYNNIDKLTEYFYTNYRNILSRLFSKSETKVVRDDEKVSEQNLSEPTIQNNNEVRLIERNNRFRKQRTTNYDRSIVNEKLHDDIAIIGISGKYPMADNLDEFWNNLKVGMDCITDIPQERWDVLKDYTTDRSQFGKIFSKWGGFIKNADLFDAKFFNISPREAEFLDPQEKLFLESCWMTLQNAGYKRNELFSKKVGVFAGVMYGEHQIYRADFNGIPVSLSSSYASIANRVSYVFGFQGPSIALDTMCSSSLTAIHMACESLKNGESEMALAGGVNLNLHPNKYRFLSQQRFLSSDGRCRAYGADGDGYVPAEGVGTVLLKPLSKAIEDNDYIYAVVKGNAINHGGRANGYTVPNPNAQRDVILEAAKMAQIDLSTVNYMEGHGTGTDLGDPIEITGLSEAVKKYTDKKQFCSIGSVKSNIGHAESAAGIAAITKVILQLQNKEIVPSIHTDKLNPKINFEKTPFYVQRELTPWNKVEKDGKLCPRRAGVSSFGAGGANAHIVLEEYEYSKEENSRSNKIVCLSAPSEKIIKEYVEKILAFIEDRIYENDNSSFDNFVYTLQNGRDTYSERIAFIADGYDECAKKLRAYLENKNSAQGIFFGNASQNRDTLDNLFEEDEINALVTSAVNRGKLDKVCKYWVSGVEPAWNNTYGKSTILHKIPLPNVPMELVSYKIKKFVETDQSQSELSVQDSVDNTALRTQVQNEVFGIQKEWKEEKINNSRVRKDKRKVLLINDFEDASLLVENVKEILDSDLVYVDNANTIDDFIDLFEQLTKEDVLPIDVVFVEPGLKVTEEILKDSSKEFSKILYLVQALQKIKYYKKTRIMYAFATQNEIGGYVNPAINGLMKTLYIENPMLNTRCVEIQCDEIKTVDMNTLANYICNELSENVWKNQYIKYIEGARMAEYYLPIELGDTQSDILSREDVIIITGGTGGVGAQIVTSLAKKYGSTFILLGRSIPNDRTQNLVSKVNELGGIAEYVTCDSSDYDAVKSIVNVTKSKYGKITGIIHCAGVLRDNFYINKTMEDVNMVLSPKLKGTWSLDNATKDENLKFFALFSSVTSEVGNSGQCDYAFANSFLDRFAEERSRMVNQGIRKGKTIAINWPFWEDGGMVVSAEDKNNVYNQTGFAPMPSDVGVNVFIGSLQLSINQLIVCYGNKEKIKKLMLDTESGEEKIHTEYKLTKETIYDETMQIVKSIIGEIVNIPVDQLDSKASFQDLGIDSNAISYFNAEMEKLISDIPKTVLFQFVNVEEVVGFLVDNYEEQLHEIISMRENGNISDDVRYDITYIADTYQQHDDINRNSANNNWGLYEQHDETNKDNSGKIAIIGISGKYPEAENVEQFWENLLAGKESICEVPKERWDIEKYYADKNSTEHGKMYCRWGGFLSNVDMFDPLFFKISPAEAIIMDPQERLFVETAWEVMEDAGYVPRKRGKFTDDYKKVGVFVGVTTNSYQLWGPSECEKGHYIFPSSVNWSIANRVSYLFDFHGPSVPVDTACSSSLEAIHMAIESIKSGESKMAIAGGVNLYLHPYKYVSMSQLKMLSPTGHCHAFSDKADGFVPGEGVGAILLKSLEEAIRDGDHIYGVISSSAVNHGGAANGYTVPNQTAQTEVILDALKKADINPEEISYIEAHGTGTKLGDPIEIEALKNAYSRYTSKKQFCSIGSVKTNIGHLESAAGIAGITKILMQMKYHKLVPSLHAGHKNSNIIFEETPFVVQEQVDEWKNNEGNRHIAAISAFGAGGSNNHIILEEYVDHDENVTICKENVFVLSAQREDVLREHARNFMNYFNSMDDEFVNLDSIAYTLQIGREEMSYGIAIVYNTMQDILNGLKCFEEGIAYRGMYVGKRDGKTEMNISKKHIEEFVMQRNMNALAECWINGIDIPWDSLYSGRVKKVSLPKYPFYHESYYIQRSQDKVSINIETCINDNAGSSDANDAINYVVPVWKKRAIDNKDITNPDTKVMILYSEIAENLKECISNNYNRNQLLCISMKEMENEIEHLDSDYLPDRIYYLNLIGGKYEIDNLDKLKEVVNDNLLKYYRFIQLINKKGYLRKGVVCKIVTNNTCTGFEESPVYAFSGGVSGVTRTLAKEIPDVKICCMDIDENECYQNSERLAQQIIEETVQKKDEEIAFRGAESWHRNLCKVNLKSKDSRFRNNGTYIIAGGLGNVGYSISKHLSEKYHANLIIMGRSLLDQKRRNKIDKLEKLGGHVFYFQGNVEDRKNVKNAFEIGEKLYGRIDGVIHSVMYDPVPEKVVELKEEELLATLSPKTEGIMSFCVEASKHKIDFVLLLSSGQVFTGNPYRGHYAAACCFEDGFAYALKQEYGDLVYIINMGFWGMVDEKPLNDEYRKMIIDTGAYPLEEDEGIECIEKILSNNEMQTCILKVKDYVLKLMNVNNIQELKVENSVEQRQDKSKMSTLSGENAVRVKKVVEEAILEVLQIKEKDLKDDKPFMDMGMDSISGSNMVDIVNNKLGIDIPQTILFDYSTVSTLVEYLCNEVKDTEELNTDIVQGANDEEDLVHIFEMLQNGEISEEKVSNILEGTVSHE
jgi:polyketide synthase PksL